MPTLPSPDKFLSNLGSVVGSPTARVIGAANALSGGALAGAVLNSPAGRAAVEMGWRYAQLGGKLVTGLLTWFPSEGGDPRYFKFPMNPEEFRESLSPNWATIQAPGQNRPIYQFVSGGERELSFTLHFYYDSADRRVIRDQLNELRALTQRPYNAPESPISGPPPVYFYFGEFMRGERFIVSQLNIRTFDLFDPAFLLPLRAEVEVTLKEALDPALTTENDPRARLNVRGRNIGGADVLLNSVGGFL